MISFRNTFFHFMFASSVFLGINADAGFWNWWSSNSYRGNKNNIETLIVTGNYMKPRFLADLILDETRQPYLLVPATGQDKIFFRTPDGPEMEIGRNDLPKFISFVNPKQIIVLGDKEYVPSEYFSFMSGRCKVYVMKSSWDDNAASIQKFMGASNLYPDFKKRFPEYAVPEKKNNGPDPLPVDRASSSKKKKGPDFLPSDQTAAASQDNASQPSDAPVLVKDNSVIIKKR